MNEAEALVALSELQRNMVRSCGKRPMCVPFRAKAVPGWWYCRKHEAVYPDFEDKRRKSDA